MQTVCIKLGVVNLVNFVKEFSSNPFLFNRMPIIIEERHLFKITSNCIGYTSLDEMNMTVVWVVWTRTLYWWKDSWRFATLTLKWLVKSGIFWPFNPNPRRAIGTLRFFFSTTSVLTRTGSTMGGMIGGGGGSASITPTPICWLKINSITANRIHVLHTQKRTTTTTKKRKKWLFVVSIK